MTKTRKPKMTAFDKIQTLLKHNPNLPEIQTALKHIGDAALIREVQRRGIWPEKESAGFLSDSELLAEYKEREFNLADQRVIREILDTKDLKALEEYYHAMT